MDIIIREKKNEKNLFQVRYYDADFCETKTLKGVYFETEEMAEKYGKERFVDQDGDSYFEDVVMARCE